MTKIFVHSVYFWLVPESSPDHILAFEKGVRTLLQTPGLLYSSVGKPASTRREIIDHGYSYHLLLIFQNEEAHTAYQTTDPTHQKFINECKSFWNKIQIYDSVNIS